MDAPKTASSQTIPRPQLQLPHNKRVKRHHHYHNLDVISNNHEYGTTTLPPYHPRFDLSYDVIELVLSFLPIKQAVQMGLLNTRLKDSWLYNRNFYFGREFARRRRRDKMIEIIDRVFSLHRGSLIRCFQLYIDPVSLDATIESWTRTSIRKGVEELDLDFSKGSERFKLSTDLIDIASLRILKLSYCVVFEFPMKLNGLSLLRVLNLRWVNITNYSILNVLRNCLNLEVLDLVHCTRIRELNIMTEKLKNFKVLKVGECSNTIQIQINSPTLCSFHYHGHVQGIYFTGTTSQLRDVMINFNPAQAFARHCHMRNLILNFDCVKVLTINSTFLEGLCSHYGDGELIEVQINLSNVKEVQLFMENASYCNPYDIASFINKCPKIEKLFIDLGKFNFECGHYWEIHLKHKFMQSIELFHHLKLIKVKSFMFQKHVLELASYFLKGAVSLETLALVTPRNCYTQFYAHDAKIYEQFLNYWRVSPIAKISISDHTNDMCFTNPKHPKIWY